MKKHNIIFLGNNERTLKALLDCNINVIAAIYELNRTVNYTGRYDGAVKSQGGKVIGIPKDDENALMEVLKDFERTALLVVSFFGILPRQALAFPEIGCLNVHPSLLPYYKGPYPINWALINGEKKIGVSFMGLDTGVDTGGIYRQFSIDITDEDDALTLLDKANDIVDKNICEVIHEVLEGSLVAEPQNGNGSYYPRLTSDVRFVNFIKMTARDIHNLTRSQVEYGGMITTFNFKRLEFFRSRIVDEYSQGEFPGVIIEINKDGLCGYSIIVQCIRGKLELFSEDETIKLLKICDKLGT